MVKTSIDVKKVAKLGNLPVSIDEERIYTDQLSKVLDYASQLEQVNTSGVEACFNISNNTNILREDEIKDSLSQEDALTNVSKKKDAVSDNKQGFFAAKGVFEPEL